MKVILYARFSPRRNAEESESIETQLDLCRVYCERNGHAVVATFADRALSGDEEDRPGLWHAIAALRRGHGLVVSRLDRLARSVYLSDIIERAASKKGATILSASGEGTWQDTNEDWLLRKILQTLAEYERRVIAARTKAAMVWHQANGRRMSDRCPYGWARDADNAALLVEDEAEQVVLARMIGLRREGQSTRRIARALQQDGIPFRGRSTWHPRTIGRILRREGV